MTKRLVGAMLPPDLGEHIREILAEMGLSAAEIDTVLIVKAGGPRQDALSFV